MRVEWSLHFEGAYEEWCVGGAEGLEPEIAGEIFGQFMSYWPEARA